MNRLLNKDSIQPSKDVMNKSDVLFPEKCLSSLQLVSDSFQVNDKLKGGLNCAGFGHSA